MFFAQSYFSFELLKGLCQSSWDGHEMRQSLRGSLRWFVRFWKGPWDKRFLRWMVPKTDSPWDQWYLRQTVPELLFLHHFLKGGTVFNSFTLFCTALTLFEPLLSSCQQPMPATHAVTLCATPLIISSCIDLTLLQPLLITKIQDGTLGLNLRLNKQLQKLKPYNLTP